MSIDKLTIVEVKELIHNSSTGELNRLLELVKQDRRKGVRNLYGTILRRIEDEQKRIKKKEMLLKEESKLWAMGYHNIGGLDEAGRGPLAGPVVAACVVFSPGTYIDGIDDSKKLSPAKRDKLFDIIMNEAKAVGIGRVDAQEIDQVNILEATRLAMEQAVLKCYPNIEFLLIDAMDLRLPVPSTSLVKGDSRSHSIAAASIIAKVTRDREMLKWHQKYPQYGFDDHKGYGTSSHIEAIQKYGLCPIHRSSFTYKIING